MPATPDSGYGSSGTPGGKLVKRAASTTGQTRRQAHGNIWDARQSIGQHTPRAKAKLTNLLGSERAAKKVIRRVTHRRSGDVKGAVRRTLSDMGVTQYPNLPNDNPPNTPPKANTTPKLGTTTPSEVGYHSPVEPPKKVRQPSQAKINARKG